MKADYVLTTFSPAMFGEKATTHVRAISKEVADKMVTPHTKLVATRPTHDRLARNQFSALDEQTARYAQLRPGTVAIHLQYRGPNIDDDGVIPFGGMVTFTLIETEEYHED